MSADQVVLLPRAKIQHPAPQKKVKKISYLESVSCSLHYQLYVFSKLKNAEWLKAFVDKIKLSYF